VITEAFQHCRGIGPARITQLHDAGLRTWHDVLATPESVPGSWRSTLVQVCRQSRQALAERDIQYFLKVFPAADRWRILAHFFEDATFFDIETTGLEFDATITVVTAWHRGQLRTFVEHENLDDFLDLLDEVQLLVSFNGSSFDVPRVISGFHIPELPCPHLDLRWSCHHRGLSGSLKHIASTLGIRRPADLDDVDGAVAVRLWHDWIASGNRTARDHLVRYCCADVLLLLLVAQQVCDINDMQSNGLWQQLPPAPARQMVCPG
jgi:uncharacterized protein YprB with RNaseH-like and TPR domain